jgi:hypothetical protein
MRMQGNVSDLDRQIQELTEAVSGMIQTALQGRPTLRGDMSCPQEALKEVRMIHSHLDLVRRSRERIRDITERLQRLHWMQEQLDSFSVGRQQQELSQEIAALEDDLNGLRVSEDMR